MTTQTAARGVPETENELLRRARGLSGRTLAQLARELGRPLPTDVRTSKGWAGSLIEGALGAGAGSRQGPDFPNLGVELKTVPVDLQGRPRESTFICSLDLAGWGLSLWDRCEARAKLSRVLWIPLERGPSTDGQRRIGAPLLWSPSPAQEALFREDWAQLTELLEAGLIDRITARTGAVLQVRPKAADSNQLRWTVADDGEPIRTLPRGIYLRARFTQELIQQSYALPRRPATGTPR